MTNNSSLKFINWIREAFAGYFGGLFFLGAISTISALMEAATFILIVPLMAAISSEGEKVYRGTFGLLSHPIVIPAWHLLLFCFGMIAVRTASQLCDGYVGARLSTRYEAEQRQRLFNYFVDASWDVQSNEKAGYLQSLLTNNVAAGMKTLSSLAVGLVSLFNFIILLTSALIVNAFITVVILIATLLLFLCARPISSMARTFAFKKADLNLSYAHALNQSVTMSKEIRVFGVAQYFKQHIGALVWSIRRARVKALFLTALVPALYQNFALMIVVFGLAAVYFTGSSQLGTLGVVVLLLLRALTYSQNFQVVYHQINESIPLINQMKHMERQYRSGALKAAGEPLLSVETLTFTDVGFHYVPDRMALNAISFECPRGEIVGIIGPSGSGKSTFVQLLLRLRQPVFGTFKVNGQPAETYSLSDWFRLISFVPQESHLLNESIADNIRFHRDGVTKEEVEAAAKKAHIHEEIISWPQGYETMAGELGGSISGGQRQRICIARALVKDPDVIVFDEPTSALDVHSESLIQETLLSLRGRVTLFIVAHRLSTLSICDRIMVFEKGRLQASAHPAALAKSNPYYGEALRLSRLS